MISNFDNKSLRNAVPEGKRHFQSSKKTSLYGSESPKSDKRFSKPRHENKIFGNDERIDQNEMKKINLDKDKRATLQELQDYNPWGKPGNGAPNMNNSNTGTSNNGNNRAKWEMEQKLKAQTETNTRSDVAFPGFGGNFGTGGNTSNKKKTEFSPNNGDAKSFENYDNGDHLLNDLSIDNRYTLDNQDSDDLHYKKFEETKALADNLEKEIQRLRMKQLEEKYDMMRNEQNSDGTTYQDETDKMSLNYQDDVLYKEAENRARMREIDRLREAYEQERFDKESNSLSENYQSDQFKLNGKEFHNQSSFHNEMNRKSNSGKRDVTNNRDDYRAYTVEEYMNCRPQLVNPTLNKRTTLSGSEDRRNNRNNVNMNNNANIVNGNQNMEMNDEENMMRKYSQTNTHENLFPPQKNFSLVKAPAAYQTRAPYATD